MVVVEVDELEDVELVLEVDEELDDVELVLVEVVLVLELVELVLVVVALLQSSNKILSPIS